MAYSISRRTFLGTLAASTGVLALGASAAVLKSDNRFVFIILRGAMDGLTAVPPLGDPAYAGLRGELAVARENSLPLNSDFALHQNLKNIHGLYQADQAVVFQAIASPYRQRSHFDAQDVLENGGTAPLQMNDGWLNRALLTLPGVGGLAVGQGVPMALRGQADITSYVPANTYRIDDETVERLLSMYETDTELFTALTKSIETDEMVGGNGKGNVRNAESVSHAVANLMKKEAGPRVAVMEINGWDTHNRQGVVTGRLPSKLAELDRAIGALKKSLGDVWGTTAVLVATEFGRTAKPNGTKGTDHGTGGAGFLLGGAVQGGRVISDWPGLGEAQLYENRDLKPTTDWHEVFKAVLSDHLKVSDAALRHTVFPESEAVKMMPGLFI